MKTPRNYQTIAIQQGIQTNLLLTDQMGLGKSITAIEIAKAIFNKYDAPCLVVCPKGIRDQWQSFIADQDSPARIKILDTDVDVAYHQYHQLDYLIIHYEAAVKYIKTLKQVAYSTLILDEVHRIKTRTTQNRKIKAKRGEMRIHTTEAIKQLKAFRKVGLTGTPYDAMATELWSLLNWLAPKTFTSYWKFVDAHFEYETDYFGHRRNFRLRDPHTFARMLQPTPDKDQPLTTYYVLGRKKRDVLPELPPLIQTRVPITLDPKQQSIYNKVNSADDIDVTIDDKELLIQNTLTKLTRLHQIASDPLSLDINAPSAKLAWLLEWLSDNSTTPVLIFTRYRRVAEHVAQLALADVLVLGGSELTKPLRSAQRIVATIAAMYQGYDLGHIDTTIYLDADWSSIKMAQSIERIDRGDNTTSKQIIFLEATHTVDHLVRKTLDNKWSQQQMIERYLNAQYNTSYQRNVIL